MTGDGLNDERTEEWTNLMDRGGLWHVDDETYDLFLAIEVELR